MKAIAVAVFCGNQFQLPQRFAEFGRVQQANIKQILNRTFRKRDANPPPDSVNAFDATDEAADVPPPDAEDLRDLEQLQRSRFQRPEQGLKI